MTTPTNHKIKLTPCMVKAMNFRDAPDLFGVYLVLDGTLVEAICQCDNESIANEIARYVNTHEKLRDELNRTVELLRELTGRFENGAAMRLLISKRLRSIEMTLEKLS